MVTITQATPKDIPDLLSMMRKLCAFHGDRCLLGLADAQHKLIDEGNLIALVARQTGRAAGYAVIEPKWNPTVAAAPFDIAHLFVVEQLRGQGIGAKLVDVARTYVRDKGAGRLTIGTSPLNPGAAAAYRAMGLDEITQSQGPRFVVPL